MIPYVEIPALEIFGPLKIQPFGVMVVTGVALGSWLIRRRARQAGYGDEEIVTALYWGLGMAFFLSHVVEIIFYQSHKLMEEGPITLFKVWDGLSSMGGFFGGLLGLWIYFAFIAKKPWLAHAEFMLQGLVVGWAFGRLGCTIVHDHPGKFTDFFLGVSYPEGVRHDLGFYELLFVALILVPANFLLYRFSPPKGSYFALICLLYAPVRFGLDFLRVEDQFGSDPRYFGLTAGHYGALALFGAGIAFLVRALRNPNDRVMPVAAEAVSSEKRDKGSREGKSAGKRKGKGKGKRRNKAS